MKSPRRPRLVLIALLGISFLLGFATGRGTIRNVIETLEPDPVTEMLRELVVRRELEQAGASHLTWEVLGLSPRQQDRFLDSVRTIVDLPPVARPRPQYPERHVVDRIRGYLREAPVADEHVTQLLRELRLDLELQSILGANDPMGLQAGISTFTIRNRLRDLSLEEQDRFLDSLRVIVGWPTVPPDDAPSR